MLTDADLHKMDIGPTFVRFAGPKWVDEFPTALSTIIHVTKYGFGGTKACSLSPKNVDNASLRTYAPDSVSGRATAVDVLYVTA